MGPGHYVKLEVAREAGSPSASPSVAVSASGVEERLRFSFQHDRAAARFEHEIQEAVAADRGDLLPETGIRAVTIVCDAHESNRAEIVYIDGDVLRFVAAALRAGGPAAGWEVSHA